MATLTSRPPDRREYVVTANEGAVFDLADNVVGEERFELRKGNSVWLTDAEAFEYLERGEIQLAKDEKPAGSDGD